jgi:hypothetical protein
MAKIVERPSAASTFMAFMASKERESAPWTTNHRGCLSWHADCSGKCDGGK